MNATFKGLVIWSNNPKLDHAAEKHFELMNGHEYEVENYFGGYRIIKGITEEAQNAYVDAMTNFLLDDYFYQANTTEEALELFRKDEFMVYFMEESFEFSAPPGS